MSETVVLEDIAFEAELGRLLGRLRLKPGTADAKQARDFLERARAMARPKAAVRAAAVERWEGNRVMIAGQAFEGRALRENLQGVERVFGLLATCGAELEERPAEANEPLTQYWWDAIGEEALQCAVAAAEGYILGVWGVKTISLLCPGALPDWPIEEQRPLFALLGEGPGRIGVRLTKSLLMLPAKSLSAMVFPSQRRLEPCERCRRQKCPARRAPYDAAHHGR